MLPQINPVVLEMGQIPLEGNLVPHSWFQHLKFHSGKSDLPAIVILSEIIYWYRPFYDEKGKLPRQKFHGDMFQSDARYYTNKFGLTKKQVRDALKRLENEGYIRREYRNIQTKEGIVLNERMFVEPVLAKIREVTYQQTITTEPKPNDSPSPTSDPPSPTSEPPSLTSEPYTKTATKIATYNKKIPTTYLEVNITKSKNSTKISKDYHLVTQPSELITTCEHVTKGHEAGVDSTHKENTIKETHLRNINTTTTTSKLSTEKPQESSSQNDNKKPTTSSCTTMESKPDDDSGLVFDFALQNFSPEQQRRTLNLLKDIPTVEDQQLVLDEFNSALKRGTVNSPWHYLSTLIKKYQTGEFTATSELPDQRAQIQKAHQRQREIEACPYCNEQGILYFSSPQESITMPCNHNATRIVNYAIKHNAEIVLAQPGYRYPSQLQRQPLTPAEIQQTKAKLAALIGGFQNE
jgi:hypothetical protein